VGPNIDPHKVFGRLGMVGNIYPRWVGNVISEPSTVSFWKPETVGFRRFSGKPSIFLADTRCLFFGLRTSSQTIKESLEMQHPKPTESLRISG